MNEIRWLDWERHEIHALTAQRRRRGEARQERVGVYGLNVKLEENPVALALRFPADPLNTPRNDETAGLPFAICSEPLIAEPVAGKLPADGTTTGGGVTLVLFVLVELPALGLNEKFAALKLAAEIRLANEPRTLLAS